MSISVAVFFGGRSTEHEISCISANQVLNALNKEKYDVVPVYISKNSEFYTGDKLFDLANYTDLDALCASLEKVCLYRDNQRVYMKSLKKSRFSLKEDKAIDVAFPVVHGTNVEDGSLAGYLETLDLPYTSAGVLGGAVGQDKAVMKDIFKAEEIPMVDYFVVSGYDFEENFKNYEKLSKKVGYPQIAKPANLGSSVGIEVIRNNKEYRDKIKECLNYDSKVVVEHMITKLKEVNIAVMGSVDEHRLSAIEEVYKNDAILSFTDKYGGKGTKGSKVKPVKGAKTASKGMASTTRKVPADLTKKQQKQIEEVASKVFRVLNSHGCVRIDFMIDEENGEVYANEINTIPGSLAFYLWKEVGIEFDKECDIMIKDALKRYGQKEKRTYSFDTNVLAAYGKK